MFRLKIVECGLYGLGHVRLFSKSAMREEKRVSIEAMI